MCALLLLGVVPAMATDKQCVKVLDYHDFGPQALAGELLGYDHFQWLRPCGVKQKKFAIKIVVYAGYSLDDIKARYPVFPEKDSH